MVSGIISICYISDSIWKDNIILNKFTCCDNRLSCSKRFVQHVRHYKAKILYRITVLNILYTNVVGN